MGPKRPNIINAQKGQLYQKRLCWRNLRNPSWILKHQVLLRNCSLLTFPPDKAKVWTLTKGTHFRSKCLDRSIAHSLDNSILDYSKGVDNSIDHSLENLDNLNLYRSNSFRNYSFPDLVC